MGRTKDLKEIIYMNSNYNRSCTKCGIHTDHPSQGQIYMGQYLCNGCQKDISNRFTFALIIMIIMLFSLVFILPIILFLLMRYEKTSNLFSFISAHKIYLSRKNFKKSEKRPNKVLPSAFNWVNTNS